MALGVQEPTQVYHPLRDVSLARDQVWPVAVAFLSSYWEPYTDLSAATPASFRTRKKASPPTGGKLVADHTPEELVEITNLDVANRIGPNLVDWQVYAENFRRAVFDTQGRWKDVKLVAAWGSMSVWPIVWGAKCLTELLEMPIEEGAQRRDVQVLRIDGANHVVRPRCLYPYLSSLTTQFSLSTINRNKPSTSL